LSPAPDVHVEPLVAHLLVGAALPLHHVQQVQARVLHQALQQRPRQLVVLEEKEKKKENEEEKKEKENQNQNENENKKVRMIITWRVTLSSEGRAATSSMTCSDARLGSGAR